LIATLKDEKKDLMTFDHQELSQDESLVATSNIKRQDELLKEIKELSCDLKMNEDYYL